MWYFMDMDEGVLDTALTKSSLMRRNGIVSATKSHDRFFKPVYHVEWDTSDGIGRDGYLYSSKEQAIADGFDWAFKGVAK